MSLPTGDISLTEINLFDGLTITPQTIILALIILVAGYIVIRILSSRIEVFAERNTRIPQLMMNNLLRAMRWVLYLFLLLIVLDTLGVDVDTIILSVAALLTVVIGFGMKDTINNLASGVWIAASKAYDINDEVEIAGKNGVVMDMNIMATELKQLDNTRVIVPNGNVWNSPITNVTRMPKRMIVLDYGVAYNTKIADAVRLALGIAERHDKLHKDPVPIVRFKQMADSAVVLQLRAWVDTDNYYPVKSEILTMLYDDLNAAGIGIPFPQVDVHLKQD
jgi:small conductance mechanosensitive channel